MDPSRTNILQNSYKYPIHRFPFGRESSTPTHTLLRTRARTFVFVLDIRHHLFTINPISRQIQRNAGCETERTRQGRQSIPEEDTSPRRNRTRCQWLARQRCRAPISTGPHRRRTSLEVTIRFARRRGVDSTCLVRVKTRPPSFWSICRSVIRQIITRTESTCIPQP
jgi:hypothetical protein